MNENLLILAIYLHWYQSQFNTGIAFHDKHVNVLCKAFVIQRLNLSANIINVFKDGNTCFFLFGKITSEHKGDFQSTQISNHSNISENVENSRYVKYFPKHIYLNTTYITIACNSN